MAKVIDKTNPDIIGTQEGKFYQLKELNKETIKQLDIWWVRKDSNLRPMDYESTGTKKKLN